MGFSEVCHYSLLDEALFSACLNFVFLKKLIQKYFKYTFSFSPSENKANSEFVSSRLSSLSLPSVCRLTACGARAGPDLSRTSPLLLGSVVVE